MTPEMMDEERLEERLEERIYFCSSPFLPSSFYTSLF